MILSAALFAVTLAATPELWVSTEGFDSEACGSEALATALRAQRPTAVVRLWRSSQGGEQPPGDAVRVRLLAGGMTVRLEVSGAGSSVLRDSSPVETCERNVELAALIVDGALDEVRVEEEAPRVDLLAPPVPLRKLLQIGAAVGGGVEQGPSDFVAAIDVEGFARYRFFEVTLDADVGLPDSTALSSTLMYNTSLSVTSLTLALGFGLAPRLGPGRAFADLLLGLALDFASASSTHDDALFSSSPQTSVEPFVGLRLGYFLDLPFGLFLQGRAEERLAFGQTDFSVAGSSTIVNTRTWTFQALGLLGYRFL